VKSRNITFWEIYENGGRAKDCRILLKVLLFINIFKYTSMRPVGHVEPVREIGNEYKILVGKSEGKRHLGDIG